MPWEAALQTGSPVFLTHPCEYRLIMYRSELLVGMDERKSASSSSLYWENISNGILLSTISVAPGLFYKFTGSDFTMLWWVLPVGSIKFMYIYLRLYTSEKRYH